MKKIISTTIILTAIIFSYHAAIGQGLYTAPFGVQAYTFRKSFPLGIAATLDSIKRMGFTELEGGGGKMPPDEFKKLCDERGIRIASGGAGYEELVKNPMDVAKNTKALGATYVMCAWIPHKGDFTLDNAKKAVTDFNAAGKVLKENGVTLCYHAHGYEFQPHEKGTLLDYIVQNTNPDYVSFEMDVLWVQFGGGDPVALLKKYGKRWKLMHLKDLRKGVTKDLTGGTSQENDVALGTGEIDIPGILKEANKVGIKHFFIEDESSHVNTQVPQSIAYLRSLKK
jgi:sugar phosphate isomerase/epimerase